MDPDPVRYLFIFGSPRSGTGALARFLNSDPRVIVGLERFKNVRRMLEPFHFREEIFFTPVRAETNVLSPHLYRHLHEKWRTGGIEIIGDKHPDYDPLQLVDAFPKARFVLLVRDLASVAASFDRRRADPDLPHWSRDHRAAVCAWNDALARLRRFDEAGYGDRAFVVLYDHFFSGHCGYARALYDFLDLSFDDQVRQAFIDWTRNWSERYARGGQPPVETRDFIAEHKDWAAEAWCIERVNRQFARLGERWSADSSIGTPVPDTPAARADARARARARALRRAHAHEQPEILRADQPVSAEEQLADAREALAAAGRTVDALERRIWIELQELAARGGRR